MPIVAGEFVLAAGNPVADGDSITSSLWNSTMEDIRDAVNSMVVGTVQNWTPTDGSGANLTLTVYMAKWWKAGGTTFIKAAIGWPTNSSGFYAQINGLPITIPDYTNGGSGFSPLTNAGQAISFVGNPNTTTCCPMTTSAVPPSNAALSGKRLDIFLIISPA